MAEFSVRLVLALSLHIFAAPVFACTHDFHCSNGAKCIFENRNDLYGVCVGGYGSGAPSDSGKKPYGETAGNSCTSDFQCRGLSKCIKENKNSLSGTCSR